MTFVEWILKIIGIFPHRSGFYYIRDVIEMTYSTSNTIIKPLYERVANAHNVNSSAVQTNIRKAIEAAHNSGKLLNLNLILETNACDESRPLTNSELIFFISNFVKSHSANSAKTSSQLYKELESKLR